jgi:hypothetical protein
MKRILVVMTTSRSSHVALEEAIRIAKEHGARLRLARVLGLHRLAEAMTRAEDWLDHVESEVPRAFRDGAVTLVGPASLAIERAAESYAADAVVIAGPTYAALVRSGIDDAFLEAVGPKLIIVRPVEADRTEPTPAAAPSRAKGEHVLLDATLLAGAASGAVIGAIGGPPGALAGAAIGTAVGVIAGRALEKAEDRAEQRERELDEEIGVLRGAVGLGSVDVTPGRIQEDESLTRAGARLAADHHRLEQLCEALAAAHVESDWTEVRAEWGLLEPALRTHMTMEEQEVLPLFRQTHPVEAEALLAEHIELRAHLDELAVDIELHAIGANRLRDFVERLRAHGRREDDLLYPWVETSTAAKPLNPLAA